MGANEKAIVKTILYADIFDYPLTPDEVWRFLAGKSLPRGVVEKTLKNLPSFISRKNGYLFISGREQILSLRKKRFSISQVKHRKAQKIARVLGFIPTILSVSLSGSLAMDNAEENADIDFFIITKQGWMWITRLCTVILLNILGVRRTRGENTSGICTNMFIDISDCMFFKDPQDIYLAHEIVQLKPLFDRHDAFLFFLQRNRWVTRILPNTSLPSFQSHEKYSQGGKRFLLEDVIMKIQLWYMKGHRTREVTTETRAFFHPVDNRTTILKQYQKRLMQYGI